MKEITARYPDGREQKMKVYTSEEWPEIWRTKEHSGNLRDTSTGIPVPYWGDTIRVSVAKLGKEESTVEVWIDGWDYAFLFSLPKEVTYMDEEEISLRLGEEVKEYIAKRFVELFGGVRK